MGQLPLDYEPPSHRDDPQTSRDAAQRAKPRIGGHARAVLTLLNTFGPMTGEQIAGHALYVVTGIDEKPLFSRDYGTRLYQVRRRLSDLRRHGLVEREAIAGKRSCEWHAVP